MFNYGTINRKFSSSRELQHLAIGGFVRELLHTAANGDDAKLHIFSAHDSTISTVICALGLRLQLPLSPKVQERQRSLANKHVDCSVYCSSTGSFGFGAGDGPAVSASSMAAAAVYDGTTTAVDHEHEEELFSAMWPEYGALLELHVLEEEVCKVCIYPSCIPPPAAAAVFRVSRRGRGGVFL